MKEKVKVFWSNHKWILLAVVFAFGLATIIGISCGLIWSKNNFEGERKMKEDFVFYLKSLGFLLMSVLVVIMGVAYYLAIIQMETKYLWYIYGLVVLFYGLFIMKLAPRTLFGVSIANGGSERFSNFTIGFFLVVNTVSVIVVMLFYEKNVIIETFWQYCWPVLATLGVTHLLAFICLCFYSLIKRLKKEIKDVVIGGIVGVLIIAVAIFLAKTFWKKKKVKETRKKKIVSILIAVALIVIFGFLGK